MTAQLAEPIFPTTTPADDSPDDYRRVVVFIALVAEAFFLPALAIAQVPPGLWLQFIAIAILAGSLLAASMIGLRRDSPWILPSVLVNAAMLTVLGVAYRPWFHELTLLFSLVVAAHAVVHGFGPAIALALLGAILIPSVFQVDSIGRLNPTDPVYAAIYLAGVALIPWVAGRLAKRRLAEVRHHLQAVTETEREAVMMLARAAEAKDDATGMHVLRVADLSALLASAAAPEEAEDIRFAAMLHDVGKLHVPDRLLLKAGPLDPDEWEIVRGHTIWGERILGTTAGFELARRVARSHHENWDGSGYPDGLIGASTPLAARIVRLADVFDALRADRPYKVAWPLDRCLEEMVARSGSLFDPDLVREFVRLVDAGVVATMHGPERARARTGKIDHPPVATRGIAVGQSLPEVAARG